MPIFNGTCSIQHTFTYLNFNTHYILTQQKNQKILFKKSHISMNSSSLRCKLNITNNSCQSYASKYFFFANATTKSTTIITTACKAMQSQWKQMSKCQCVFCFGFRSGDFAALRCVDSWFYRQNSCLSSYKTLPKLDFESFVFLSSNGRRNAHLFSF